MAERERGLDIRANCRADGICGNRPTVEHMVDDVRRPVFVVALTKCSPFDSDRDDDSDVPDMDLFADERDSEDEECPMSM